MKTKCRNASHVLVKFILAFPCIIVACQPNTLDKSQKPDETRFTTTVMTEPGDLDEPMAFTFVNNDEVLFVERKGGVKSLDVKTRTVATVGQVPVNSLYVNKEGQSRAAEEGLMGIVAHPKYAENHWIFMLYADPDEPKHVLARWKYADGKIDETSKAIVLEYPTQREECCHTGGGMVFDQDGNLFITTGNNTVNPPQGTSNLDERPGYKNSDDQRTAGNTNDLRGKILRIHPEDDGGYSIPEGNLFAEGTEKARAEIYTMGHRNPWRVSVDSKTGYIYWGEVGPDASEDTDQGPRGYDEFNQAKGPGFFGWPYFIGGNKPYADYDYETDSIYGIFDINHVVNESPNNTGLRELPKPQKAFFWYPYGYSEEFPLLGSAGRSATGGPVFRQADFPSSDRRFPSYYEGKWFITEFMRGWIIAVGMDENGDFVSMEKFLPGENFSSAIDMQFSPDGDLYVLEYGSAWFRGNDNAQIKRIQYNGGNRPPIVMASADKKAGAIPLSLKLSSEGTIDYDKEHLEYEWSLQSANGFDKKLTLPNPEITLEEPGSYAVTLKVSDQHGNSSEQSFEVVAGNEPPSVDIKINGGNQSFFFADNEIKYEVQVADLEDGSLAEGEIRQEAVAINFDYVPEGFDPIEIAQNHKATDDWVTFSKGKNLIDESDCLSCHRIDIKSIGPSYEEVAKKYAHDPKGQEVIAERIIKGRVGFWGEHAMSAHPDLSPQDAQQMVSYIMSLNDPQPEVKSISMAGLHRTTVPTRENGKGSYLLRATYTDKGGKNLKPLSAEKIIVLRNPILNAEKCDAQMGTQLLTTPGRSFNIIEDGAYLGYHHLDLTNITELLLHAEASSRVGAAGAEIECRLDSPTGPLIGTTDKVVSADIDFRAELQKLRAEWEAGGKVGPRPGFRTVREKFQKKYPVNVSGIDGIHHIYLVFKNRDAKPGQILVQMQNLEFVQGDQPVQ